jgi:hypothetical protein
MEKEITTDSLSLVSHSQNPNVQNRRLCFPSKWLHSCWDGTRSWAVLFFSLRCKPHISKQASRGTDLVWFPFQHWIQMLYLPRKEIKPFFGGTVLSVNLKQHRSAPSSSELVLSQQPWSLHFLHKPRIFPASPPPFSVPRLLFGSPFP